MNEPGCGVEKRSHTDDDLADGMELVPLTSASGLHTHTCGHRSPAPFEIQTLSVSRTQTKCNGSSHPSILLPYLPV